MTPEHKEKLRVARVAYIERRRAEKAALKTIVDENNPAELSPHIANSFNGPAKNQSPEIKETKSTISAREKTQMRVNKKLDKLVDAQIDAATGMYYVTADGKHVYKKIPDTSTGQYLLNQLIGKPKESIEVKTTNLNLDL